ncbi:hemin ABC transporter substrate-binding protein [Pseudohoeflea suaedae]|uniref:Hemin ABC transporter substrate-binding protein n=1 Tax=Pseudohoeflea suaedae TaxID=877384 RepID=A0A4R5PPQ9_9HYPH|nr:hemin ABC transporter substrate-binding protein [Pseudohoeflea suaedae]TDH39082.1 hemin ABC transporter substrate-binding protein [Pseudohoeflea suaedae]
MTTLPVFRAAGRSLALAAGLAAFLSSASAEDKASRIVSIGGSVTEIVYALGEEARLTARDQTSIYPEAAKALPDVGYIRQLSPEGVLSVNPDLVIALEGYGPPEARQVIEAAGVPIAVIPEAYDGAGVIAKIEAIAKALGAEAQGQKLARTVQDDLDAAADAAARIEKPAKVLFVLALRDGRIMAAGAQSHAQSIIEMAGAENALSGFDGYKPVTDEAILAAAPDVILLMDRGINESHDTQDAALLALPAVSATPAGRDKALIRMDGQYLLGFGPRTAQAARELATRIADLTTGGSN